MANHAELRQLRDDYSKAADKVLELWPADTDPDELDVQLRTQIEQAMTEVADVGKRFEAARRK